jgi:hypothetical protein
VLVCVNVSPTGDPLQRSGGGRHPADAFYGKQWTYELRATYEQRLDATRRPAAHAEYLRSHDALVGRIANEDWRYTLLIYAVAVLGRLLTDCSVPPDFAGFDPLPA